MEIADCFKQLARPRDDLRLREPLTALERLIQALPLDEVHHCIDGILLHDEVVNLWDVCVAQILKGVNLAAEALRLRGNGALIRFQDDPFPQP